MTCEQCTDLWNWVAVYANGQRIVECVDGRHRVYADLDLNNVVSIRWEPNRTNIDGIASYRPDVSYTPVLFRRRLRGVNIGDGEIAQLSPIHGLGWETQDDDGRSFGTYTFLFEDGSVVTSNDRNAV